MAQSESDSFAFVSTEENVVLSDLLFYITNRVNTHPPEIIRNACDQFYNAKAVAEEKTRFFASISKNAPRSSRSPDKKLKDIEDIIHEMKAREKSLGKKLSFSTYFFCRQSP